MRYVGYSEYFHDAALAIVNPDGKVAYASQSERYSKIKNDELIFPEMWNFVNDDDHVTFYEDINLRKKMMGGYRTFGAPKFRNQKEEQTAPISNSYLYDDFNLHHESHCALAFFTRPWQSKEDTVCVSVDGSGELESVAIHDHNLKPIKKVMWPQSLGMLYGTVTGAIGLKSLRDEYIVMGLSSYGEVDKQLYDILYNGYYWFESEQGLYEKMIVDFEQTSIAESSLSAKFVVYETRIKNRCKEISMEDAAATVQNFFEVEVLKIMKEARKYGSKLVYGGGCAQNVIANSMIRELFDDMHIAIAPNDAGNALGCAAYTWHKNTGGTHLDWSPYLGHNIDRDINPKEVAKYLVENRVCGIANGRAEYGPRALGNRSLIADVRYDVKDTVNEIKKRHKFRPFGPAILSEFQDHYFDGHKNEYMQYAAIAKHPYDSVTHIDNTARVQVVKPDCKSVLRQILEEYFELTQVPMLLNTSLNIRNQPMVNTIEDAIEWEKKYNVRVF